MSGDVMDIKNMISIARICMLYLGITFILGCSAQVDSTLKPGVFGISNRSFPIGRGKKACTLVDYFGNPENEIDFYYPTNWDAVQLRYSKNEFVSPYARLIGKSYKSVLDYYADYSQGYNAILLRDRIVINSLIGGIGWEAVECRFENNILIKVSYLLKGASGNYLLYEANKKSP